MEWLRIQAGGNELDQARIEKETGIPQPTLSKWFAACRESKDPRVSLQWIERAAARRRTPAWQIVQEAEFVHLPEAGKPRKGTLSVVDQARLAWEELFTGDPLRGKRVLVNLQQQEELGYTDLVSQIVREIIDRGPKDSVGAVVQLLTSFEEKDTKRLRELRAQFATKYRRLR